MIPPEVTGFLEYKRVEIGLADATREAYGRILSKFSSWLGDEGRTMAKATRDDISGYLASCWDAKLNPATIGHQVSVLREFYKHLRRDGVITRDPMLRIESPKQWKRVHKGISEDEARQLLGASDDWESALGLRDRAILESLYSSAMRVNELVTATLADLDLNRRVLSVVGKGTKTRLVPVGLPAAFALQKYLDIGRPLLVKKAGTPFLFIGRRGLKLTRCRVWQIVREACERANVPKISPHVLRHSAATHMLNHGGDLRSIQTILGHADISTTEIYTKCSQEHLRDVLARCGPRRNQGPPQIRMFEPSPILVPGPTPCEECARPAMPGKHRCEKHGIRARIARRKHHEKKRAEVAL